MLCCFAFQFEVRWIQVNRRKPKIWDGPWTWEVGALSDLFRVSINIAFWHCVGSSRIAPVALHFLISTSQFCKVWHSASIYTFLFDVHLSSMSMCRLAYLGFTSKVEVLQWQRLESIGFCQTWFVHNRLNMMEQWFDSYFSGKKLAKCSMWKLWRLDQAHIL